jgi:hypothetical protein
MQATSLVVLLGLITVTGSDCPNRSLDDLDKARQQYRDTVKKAQKDYDATVETAAAKLREHLLTAIQQAAQARQAETTKALSAELETLAAGSLPVFGAKGSVGQGTWRVVYHPSDAKRTYVVKPGGEVACEELGLAGKIRQEEGSLMLDLHDGKLERLTFAGGRVFVEHFDPKESFPRPAQVGIGESVSAR